jgi:hypothetical protein
MLKKSIVVLASALALGGIGYTLIPHSTDTVAGKNKSGSGQVTQTREVQLLKFGERVNAGKNRLIKLAEVIKELKASGNYTPSLGKYLDELELLIAQKSTGKTDKEDLKTLNAKYPVEAKSFRSFVQSRMESKKLKLKEILISKMKANGVYTPKMQSLQKEAEALEIEYKAQDAPNKIAFMAKAKALMDKYPVEVKIVKEYINRAKGTEGSIQLRR